MPTYTSPTIASGTGYVQPASCSVSTDANSFYAACWGTGGENTGNPFAVSDESPEPTATGEDTRTVAASQATSAADGSFSSDQGTAASPSSIASSPSMTFNLSSTSAPSASGINAQDNTSSGAVIHAKVSFPILTGVQLGFYVASTIGTIPE
ncbi:hypothetical protein EIP86_010404 [Pleurotus ostreatoroseus]|nr:hypothetical protein EIP86_010404 [Pleurotus ostreatoroseus]